MTNYISNLALLFLLCAAHTALSMNPKPENKSSKPKRTVSFSPKVTVVESNGTPQQQSLALRPKPRPQPRESLPKKQSKQKPHPTHSFSPEQEFVCLVPNKSIARQAGINRGFRTKALVCSDSQDNLDNQSSQESLMLPFQAAHVMYQQKQLPQHPEQKPLPNLSAIQSPIQRMDSPSSNPLQDIENELQRSLLSRQSKLRRQQQSRKQSTIPRVRVLGVASVLSFGAYIIVYNNNSSNESSLPPKLPDNKSSPQKNLTKLLYSSIS